MMPAAEDTTMCNEELLASSMAQTLRVPHAVARFLVSRGVRTLTEAHRMLCGNAGDVHDPFLMKGMKEAVGGLIEPIYYLDEPRAVMVGNEEAKLIGMEGNRRFGERIVAGPFFICGEKMTEDGMDFCSLSDELCEKYVQKFAVPESISQDEVEQDMGFTLIGL